MHSQVRCLRLQSIYPVIGGFKGQGGPGASRMQEILLAAGALPRTPLGEITALPQTP